MSEPTIIERTVSECGCVRIIQDQRGNRREQVWRPCSTHSRESGMNSPLLDLHDEVIRILRGGYYQRWMQEGRTVVGAETVSRAIKALEGWDPDEVTEGGRHQ